MKLQNHKTQMNPWNILNQEALKPMTPQYIWNHKTSETLTSLTPRNLWNHKTHETKKPRKYKIREPRNPWKLWNQGTLTHET